ncbi:catalase-like [Aricia agestis]|uniref:catalase-like n=1 Tax=Aricia agestis TaxID=91739 RepID=UPI001C208EE3|nr:catalase-like [Aricia agestis]
MKEHNICMFQFLLVCYVQYVACGDPELVAYYNRTDPAARQLWEFKNTHPEPIGLLTTGSGKLVDIRETVAINSDPFSNLYNVDIITQLNAERVPERVVHAKGTAAFGYFEVTHDVSKYTKADVFNGIGKKTPLVARFSTVLQSLGGADASREMKGLAVKMYTNEGNLDFLCINFPTYFYRDANDFLHFVHSFKRNPKTDLPDFTSAFDFITKRPDSFHGFLWFLSDFGIPNGYRKMDSFPVHTYVINNKKRERYFVRFSFRSEQGVENLSSEDAREISSRDPNYFNRDLYNAIEEKNYPAWRLEMDLMTYDQIKKVDYNPFEVTRSWKKGTYKTVPIGRLVLDRNPDNNFAVSEQSTFSPARLVPGIPGPIDTMFRTRRQSYRDAQSYRMSINHNKIEVNAPKYSKNYLRDGKPPVGENGRDAPNYYPNSFNGPIPYVDADLPKERLSLLESNAVDLEPAATFYNDLLNCQERERLANNSAPLLAVVPPFMQRRMLKLFTLVDVDLGRRVTESLEKFLRTPPPPPPKPLIPSEKYYKQQQQTKKKKSRNEQNKPTATEECYRH